MAVSVGDDGILMETRKTTSETGGDAAAGPTPGIGRGRPRRWVFAGAAMLAGLLPLVVLEAGLRLFDVGRPAENPDPFSGFNRNFPLFERQGAVYRTARARAPFIGPQEFPAEKPRNGFRIFCFGGSTVYGHPYLADTAFPKWLELELTGRDPARSWQAINCGGVSYASYRIVPMVKEVMSYQPDLIIVATGHNEFLEDRTYHSLKSRSAVWQWVQARVGSLHLAELVRGWVNRSPAAVADAPDPELAPTVITRLDFDSGYASYRRDDAWHQSVLAQYDDSVREIVATCRKAHVPILLVRLGSNLRDCPPFKSEHRAGLVPEVERDWQAAFDLATVAEKPDPGRALRYYLEAAAIDPQYALLDYRIARLLDRTGRAPEALPYYQQARDEDICPLRIMAPLEEALRRIAAETRVPLVDAATMLASRCPDGIPGFDWYVDHVHPTIGGHQQIARALAAEMRTGGLLPAATAWPEAKRIEAYARHLGGLGHAYFTDGERRVGWLENWAKRQRLAGETFPCDAAGYARLSFRRLDLGQDEAAWTALREALTRDGAVIELIRKHAGDLLAEGRADRAALLRGKLDEIGREARLSAKPVP